MYLHTLLLTQELQQKAEAKVTGLEAQIAMLRDQLSLLQVRSVFTCLAMSISLMRETLRMIMMGLAMCMQESLASTHTHILLKQKMLAKCTSWFH